MNNDLKFLEEIINYSSENKNNIFKYKQILKQKLKNKFATHFPLSNINKKYFSNEYYKYYYDYQRYDSQLEYYNFFENFYNVKNLKTKTIFTSSGMAAISSIINTLDNNTKYSFKFKKDTYFETQKLINIISKKKIKIKKILWLDSISYNFDFCIDNIYKYEIIVIDTTCFHPDEFKKIIQTIYESNKLCILIRSHTKLDMLGLEYCTLGSVTYIIPKFIDRIKFDFYKKLIIFNMDYIGNSGLGITESNIFPLLSNPEFIKLNQNRIKRINSNNKYAYERLSKYYNFIMPNHFLFFLLNININYSLEELKNKLIEHCDKEINCCCFSPSFGFDYIALDTYFDYNMRNYTIRISIGDIDKQVIDHFIESFMEFVNDNL